MGAFTSWVRGRKALASGVALAVLAGVPVTLALLHQGFPVTDLNLKARDVWVTNGQKLLGGRLDHQIGELDAKVNGASSHLDVLQDGGDTLLTDTSQGTVQKIDPAFVSLTEKITIPVGSQLAYGKNTLAILADSGKLWILDTSAHLAFDKSKTAVAAKLGPDAQVAVSKDGKVFAVSPEKKKLYTFDRPGAAASTTDFPELHHYQLTAVGDTPVVLDTKHDELVWSDGSTTKLSHKALRIQQAGPDNDYVLVATGDSLLEVTLNSDDVRRVSADITRPVEGRDDVSAPVFLNGCAYGAWAGAQKYLYACDGKDPVPQDIGQPTTGDDLEFRVNHGVIALNNLQDGNAWIVSSHMRLVNNWAQVNPDRVTKSGQKGEEKPVRQSFEDMIAHRSAVDRPPVAEDDNLGVRPSRTTVLPVLSNDTDPDGDVLTIVKVDKLPASQGTIDVISGGRALQFTPVATQVSTVSFRYTVSDGRHEYDSAQVNVTVRPLTENEAPTATRTSTTKVEVGQSVRYNVLNDWIDPDGDDIFLVGAESTTADSVQYTPDGYVTFTSKTGQTGSKEVKFTVSDGHKSATGSLMIEVKPAGTLDPVAVPDFVSTFAGNPVVVHPLKNDRSPSGNTLELVDAKREVSGGGSLEVDSQKQTVTFTSSAPGPVYLKYTLAAGSKSTEGLILVDVTKPPTTKAPPVAVRDIVYVRPGEPSTVNVLDNDVSPTGRVLVVKSVSKSEQAQSLNVEVLADSVVRVTAPGVLQQQVQLKYEVSDGYNTATAGITVVPIPPLVNHQAPVAVADTATVRAGDVVSVHVLDNDYSPDNEPFTLDKKLKSAANAGKGAIAFVSNDLVRYQAPAKAGTYSVEYTISDKYGQHATATVNFLVTPPKHNKAPEPQELTARAFAGSAVVVDVPLDGIDPDGDSVILQGIKSPPTLGRITKQTPTSLTYQAYPDSKGTDSFTYAVADTHGKKAIGSIRIGVVPRPSTVKPPTAVDDHVEVKPGKIASVPVLKNDSDPNGYVISLKHKLPEVQKPLKAKVHGSNVMITAPKKEGAYLVRYQITNGQGGQATAYIQVLVTKDAKPRYPTAVDHVIDVYDLDGKKPVTVDVYKGAQNPSGYVEDLKVSLEGSHADRASVHRGGKVTVKPGKKRMAITYALTDPTTGLAGKAFIIVPPRPDSPEKHENVRTPPPRIKPGLPEQVVKMNGTKTWKLKAIIDVPSGRPAKITGPSGVTATNSDGSSSYGGAQTLTFTPAKDYRGPAAITFRVNDGKEEGASKDRITLLTLPITVGSPDKTDVPPTFTPPNMTIEAGEAAQTIDLRASSYHPNPDVLKQLTYMGLKGSTSKITASLSGSTLKVSAPFGVQPGATAKLTFTVNYKDFHIPGSVNVRVVSSSRPMAHQKNPPQHREIQRGDTAGVSIKAVSDTFWINPFPDHPLTILSAHAVSSPNGVTVTHTGSSIRVKAGSGAATGDVNVRYKVQDATKDPARVQIGRLTVTIHDVPDAPPKPSDVNATDGRATLKISAPKSDHGKAIDKYRLDLDPGSTQRVSLGGNTITGLTNGTSYRFRVQAHNADGWSAWSSWSASVTPWGTPSKPRDVKITRNDQYAPTKVHLSWSAPSDAGGGGLKYRYNFDGNGWSGWSTDRSVTKSVGVGTYSFKVQAKNGGGKKSDVVTSDSVTVKKKPNPPDPKVTLSKGNGPVYSDTCLHGCFHFHVVINNFGKNKTYTVKYYCTGWMDDTDSIHTNGDGHGVEDSTYEYCGYPGAYVSVNGVKSNTVDFRNN